MGNHRKGDLTPDQKKAQLEADIARIDQSIAEHPFPADKEEAYQKLCAPYGNPRRNR